MQMSDKSRKALRYRAYFWLMNASLVAVIYGAIELNIELVYGYDISELLPEPARSVFGAYVAFFVLVIPVFLICTKFMRDEYCEQLWKRSFVVLAYMTAIAPLTYLAAYWSLFYALGQPKPLPPYLKLEQDVALGFAIFFPWVSYMMTFVLVFQFLRWKDTR